jgi:ADP-ribose pyrophosphatase YjhB (NUDIX family)
MVELLEVDDPTTIDWPRVQASAWIPFAVVGGRPVNPFAPTGVRRGRNRMRHWSERKCSDAKVTCTVNGKRYLLLIENDRGWGLPGGGLKRGETIREGCSRELREETGLRVAADEWQRIDRPRYMPDERGSDESWPVTVICHVDLGVRAELPPVKGEDDALRAAWVAADTYIEMRHDLAARFGGVVMAAHRFALADVLQPAVDADDLALAA